MTSRYLLDPAHTDPTRLKREREKARELRKSAWWKAALGKGMCHYCHRRFPAAKLTMDHVVPLARGGESIKSNLVPACRECNENKKLEMPVDRLFEQLEAERLARESDSDDSSSGDE
ncbi:MAG: HNH endonuclease, partial [Proteobacteria bacterium]